MDITTGMRLLVKRGENSRSDGLPASVRENVTGRVVGTRGPIVVIDRDDDPRYAGEGVWAFTSDVEII